MSKFNDFIADVKTKGGVDVDGAYGKQCMDLYNYYSEFMFGAHQVGASCAKEVINNQNVYNFYDRIDNYLEFVPQKGDVAVWLGGEYGHIAICLGEGDINKFKTLDQNWKPQQLTEEIHDYIYMAPLVFLRPKDQSGIVESVIEQPVEVPVIEDTIKVGDKVKVLNAIQYNGETFKTWFDVYEVIEVVGDRVVIGVNGVVTCAINIKDIQKI